MNRIELLDRPHNGTPIKVKQARKTPRKPRQAQHADSLRVWALSGVAVMSIMSASLNGYANSQHAPAAWAGWGMGIMIPVIVLILGKVAGLVYARGFKAQAKVIGAVGLGLLFLSVWHCASSIALLTGSPIWLTLPMAIAIDMGLVACEVAGLLCD